MNTYRLYTLMNILCVVYNPFRNFIINRIRKFSNKTENVYRGFKLNAEIAKIFKHFTVVNKP